MSQILKMVISKFMTLRDRHVGLIVKHVPTWINANDLSMVRILSILLIIPPIILGHYGTAFILVLLSCLLDFIDGPLARYRNQVSEFGKMIDPVADKIVFLATLIALVYSVQPELISRRLMWALIILELVSAATAFFRQIVSKILEKDIEVGSNFFGKVKFNLEVIGILIFLVSPLSLTCQLIASYFLKTALFFLICSISYHVYCTLGGYRPFQQ